jgi:hypothetical protein
VACIRAAWSVVLANAIREREHPEYHDAIWLARYALLSTASRLTLRRYTTSKLCNLYCEIRAR